MQKQWIVQGRERNDEMNVVKRFWRGGNVCLLCSEILGRDSSMRILHLHLCINVSVERQKRRPRKRQSCVTDGEGAHVRQSRVLFDLFITGAAVSPVAILTLSR